MRRLAGLITFITVIPLVVLGCSDDALSKEEYIEQGDEICKQVNDDLEALAEPATPRETVEFFDEYLDLAGEARDEFEELEPPDDGEDVHEALVASIDGAIAAAGDARDAAADDDEEAFEDAIAEGDEASGAADEEAEEYGFNECGES